MTRAVIKLKHDISHVLPLLGRVIDGCAYNAEMPVASFRYKNFGVIAHRRDVIITNAGDEASVREVMGFLKDITERADTITEKVRTY